MKKVIVIGCPGSGKSTFAVKLHEKIGNPLYHLDLLNWNADKTTVSSQEFLRRQQSIIEKESWILDGNYGSTLELRMQACDTVFFLDYPVEMCLEGVRNRMGKPRSDIPWVEEQEDPEFMEFILNFPSEQRPAIQKLLEKYPGKTIHIFKTRQDAERFLNSLEKSEAPVPLGKCK